MKNSRLWFVVAAVVAWLPVTVGHAGTFTWTGGSSGTGDAWRQRNNWAPAAGQGGPGAGQVAVFATGGTAASIGINFNDGRGLTNSLAALVLTNGGNRAVFNSAPHSTGTLELDGWQGLLVANYSASSVLALSNGATGLLRISLPGGGEIHTASAASGVVFAGPVEGALGFVKTGAGWLRLTQSNSLTGSVVVAGGRLELAAPQGGALGSASTLRIEGGATAVLVSGQQLGVETVVDLAGGTLRGAGGASAVEEQAGALTLSASSTIDLGASALRLADSSGIMWEPSATLTITNWGGVSGGGLFFGIGGLTSTQLAQIYFADLGVYGAQLVGPDGELTPIPEAPTAVAAAALLAFIVWRERRRLRAWWKR